MPDADCDGIPDVLDKCMLDSRNAQPAMDCDTHQELGTGMSAMPTSTKPLR